MQVKCIVERNVTTSYWPNSIATAIERGGSAVLESYATHFAGSDAIYLKNTNFGGDFNSSWGGGLGGLKGSFPKRCDVLFILGGRRSIIDWLRLQDQNPMIVNNIGSTSLFMTIMRKKRMLDKDLTMVAIHPFDGLNPHASEWHVSRSFDMLDSSEAPRSKFVDMRLGEFTPSKLASYLNIRLAGLHF